MESLGLFPQNLWKDSLAHNHPLETKTLSSGFTSQLTLKSTKPRSRVPKRYQCEKGGGGKET